MGSKSDIKPRRVTTARECGDSFMCITARYMDRQHSATYNISCFTCGEKARERNDVFSDQTLMSAEKYEPRQRGRYLQRSYLKHQNFSLGVNLGRKDTFSQMWKENLPPAWKHHVLCKSQAWKCCFYSSKLLNTHTWMWQFFTGPRGRLIWAFQKEYFGWVSACVAFNQKNHPRHAWNV